MTAEVQNTGAGDLTYELALHTYLTVGDVETIRLHGLERTRVETANCGPHAVRLAPGARHAMTARIDVAARS